MQQQFRHEDDRTAGWSDNAKGRNSQPRHAVVDVLIRCGLKPGRGRGREMDVEIGYVADWKGRCGG